MGVDAGPSDSTPPSRPPLDPVSFSRGLGFVDGARVPCGVSFDGGFGFVGSIVEVIIDTKDSTSMVCTRRALAGEDVRVRVIIGSEGEGL